jgi:hypothetical protein
MLEFAQAEANWVCTDIKIEHCLHNSLLTVSKNKSSLCIKPGKKEERINLG